jgi:hypothetical protein
MNAPEAQLYFSFASRAFHGDFGGARAPISVLIWFRSDLILAISAGDIESVMLASRAVI